MVSNHSKKYLTHHSDIRHKSCHFSYLEIIFLLRNEHTVYCFYFQGVYNLKVKITLKRKHSRKQNILFWLDFLTFLAWFQMSPFSSFTPSMSHKKLVSDYISLIFPLSHLREISPSETVAMSTREELVQLERLYWWNNSLRIEALT